MTRMGLIARIAPLIAAAALAAPAQAGTLVPVELPRDQGAHPQSSVEWWYTTGHATTPRGRRLFWFATIWSSPMGVIGRVNVVDLKRDRVVLAHQWTSLTPLAAGARDLVADGLRIRWRPAGRFGRLTVAAVLDARDRLDLTLVPQRPYALHGDHGIVRQGAAGTSAYYSATRIAATGRLRVTGHVQRLRGLAWFDHQWGDFAAAPGALRWDWFACQLADGRDLMLYRFIDAQDRALPGAGEGTLVNRDGRARRITSFTATPRGPELRPPGAKATYPLAWRLRVPGAHLDLSIRAAARHQFVPMQYLPSFWEGAATIVRGPRGACTVEDSREAPAG
jgi:predicted secreted hydrolase